MTQCSGWQSPGWSNPNLLINWDFRNPVNQRGQTSYTTEMNTVYSLDCWQIGGNGSLNIEDGYIRVVRKTYFENLFQKIEKTSELAGKTIIFSACIDGQANMTFNVNGNYPMYAFRREEGIGITELSYTLPEDVDSLEVIIQPSEDNKGFDLYAVKLEVGSISTLALDLMQPSDYTAELRKCQRYFQRIPQTVICGYGSINGDGTKAFITLPLVVPMRIEPTITIEKLSGIRCKGEFITEYTSVENWTNDANIGAYKNIAFIGNFANKNNQPCVAEMRYNLSAEL